MNDEYEQLVMEDFEEQMEGDLDETDYGNNGRCQFAALSNNPDQTQCEKPATRQWGGVWFCEEHGKRK